MYKCCHLVISLYQNYIVTNHHNTRQQVRNAITLARGRRDPHKKYGLDLTGTKEDKSCFTRKNCVTKARK